MFRSKTYNLVYGRFLAEHASECEIIYYKQPSRAYMVDYRNIAEEVWQTGISDKYPEDVKREKLIANVNFGLTEKSTNNSRGCAFDCSQKQIGGKTNKVSSLYKEEVDNGNNDVYEHIEKEGDKQHYCLIVSDRATLRDGYISIEELLLRHHTHTIYEDYNRLVANHIDV